MRLFLCSAPNVLKNAPFVLTLARLKTTHLSLTYSTHSTHEKTLLPPSIPLVCTARFGTKLFLW